MNVMDTLYRCPECAALWRQNTSVGPWTLEPRNFSCSRCRAWVTLQARKDSAASETSADFHEIQPHPDAHFIPGTRTTCSNPAFELSQSPYRWDTGELIKGKLLVCRECGEYREAETGTSGSSPEVVRLPGRVTLNGKPLPAVHSLTYSIGATAAHPAIPEHAIHSIGSGVVCCFTNVDLDAQQKSLVTGALADDAVTFFQTTIAIPPGGQRIDASGKLVPR